MRLGFRCKCNCKFLLKNTTHHVITCGVSLQVFLQLETLSEQRRKSKTAPHVSYDTFILSICGDNLHDGTRTILKQLRPKLCKDLRTTNLGENLPVLIKKSVYHRGQSWLVSFSYSLSMILSP